MYRSCAPFCTMEKSEGRYKDNFTLLFHLDRGILKEIKRDNYVSNRTEWPNLPQKE